MQAGRKTAPVRRSGLPPKRAATRLDPFRKAFAAMLAVMGAMTSLDPTARGAGVRPLTAEYLVEHSTRDSGLPHNNVQCVLQTRDGYLWAGTRWGLGRFDGVKWTVLRPDNTPALGSPDCRALAEDQQDRLWLGTTDGLAALVNRRWVRPEPAQSLLGCVVRTLCVSATGSLWIGTDRGLSRLTGDRLDRFGPEHGLRSDDTYALAEDSNRTLWVGTAGGLYYLEADSDRFRDDRHPPGLAGHRTTGLYEDTAHRLWVTTAMNAESYYAHIGFRLNGQWSDRPGAGVWAPGFQPVPFAEQPDGTVWIPQLGDSVFRVQEAHLTVHVWGDREVVGDWIAGLEHDREGNLWLGSNVTGLRRVQARRVRLWTTRDGLPRPETWTACQTRDGALWVGTEGGLCRFDPAAPQATSAGHSLPAAAEPSPDPPTPTVWTEAQDLSRNMVRALLEDPAGRLWIGTGGGLDCFEGGRLFRYRFPGAWYDSKIRSLCLGQNDRLWIAAARNLFGVDLKTLPAARDATTGPLEITPFVCFNPTNGLPTEDIRAVWEQRDGSLWVGTYGGGLCRLQGDRWDRFTTTNGLPSNRFWAFYEDADGRLWIGTERGLALHDHGRFTSFTRGQGYFADAVHQVIEDDTGHLWVAADRGIGRAHKQALLAYATERGPPPDWVVYDETEGLLSAETNGQKNHPAACKLRDGRVCFPTTKGVVAFDPQNLPDIQTPPLVLIEEIRANGQTVYGDNAGPVPTAAEAAFSRQLELAPGTAHLLEFRYTAPTFAAAKQVRFEYRLGGLDKAWIAAGARREATYANLRPGHYRFQVRAMNKYGVASAQPATFALKLRPFFHQTGWFYAACAGSALATALGFYRWRLGYVRRIHRLEQENALARERARIAKDLHDGLGANLTQLTLLADQAEDRTAEPRTLARHLRELSQSTRATVSGLKDFLWATNAADVTLEGLVTRICQHAETFLGPAGLRCRFDVPVDLPAIALEPHTRHHLFLAAKEALNNVVRHARASEVRVRAVVTDSRCTLIIEDNGCGFATAPDPSTASDATRGCHGLATMRQRVEEAGGTFSIASQPGRGTEVRFAFRT